MVKAAWRLSRINLMEFGKFSYAPSLNYKVLDKTSYKTITMSPLENVTSVGTNS